jgi:hypothetical protein
MYVLSYLILFSLHYTTKEEKEFFLWYNDFKKVLIKLRSLLIQRDTL